MSLRMQAVLLRFAETGEIQPVGADRPAGRTDVRLITATNRDLRAQIDDGKFREDLYYRLNVIQIRVPPLRERAATTCRSCSASFPAARQRARTACRCPTLTPEAEAVLLRYPWPGNVRELKNITERLVVRDTRRPITAADLPSELREESGEAGPSGAQLPIAQALPATPTSDPSASQSSPIVDLLWQRLLDGDTFWAVADMYKNHDITRADLRMLIHRGLQYTRGNYRALLSVFHLPADDYKRFQAFLFQHKCNLPFRSYRVGETATASLTSRREYNVAS